MTKKFETTHIESDTTDENILENLRILVVDDNNDCLTLITYILESYGIQVVTASNAYQAFEIVKHESVDFLISDLAMPEESGFSLIQKIRKLKLTYQTGIPAIALTGIDEEQICKKALFAGFQSCMNKPLDLKELISEITKLLMPNQLCLSC